MSRATVAISAPALPNLSTTVLTPAYQAYEILHVGFAVLPIVAGLDKFIHFLGIGSWEMYLSPVATRMTGLEATTFMHIVGVVEVIAGLLVAFWPRVGGYVVMLWLWGIIVNLFLIPGFFDVALRDFGLSLGAIALARLSEEHGGPIH
jgi:hypothetical protein